MNAAYTLGRILVPLVFIVAGIQQADERRARSPRCSPTTMCRSPIEIVPYLGSMPKYEALGYLVAAIEVICGLMILVGLKARWGALVLIVFTAVTIIFVHHFWDMTGDAFYSNLTQALKNLSIMGGLLLIVAVGPGPASVERS